jgi:uncharacterized protein with von Willebrand factor type A (vWA) domain
LKRSEAGTTKQNILVVAMSIPENLGVPFGDGLERISPKVCVMLKSTMEWKTSCSLRMIWLSRIQYKSQMSTVLMIDISHSMILYGEDRITPAKKVAMALAEIQQDIKDTLDILVFGNDAWTIAIKDLPYLKVGPFHTNTVAGLQRWIYCEEKEYQQTNFMITDGKPSCVREKMEAII